MTFSVLPGAKIGEDGEEVEEQMGAGLNVPSGSQGILGGAWGAARLWAGRRPLAVLLTVVVLVQLAFALVSAFNIDDPIYLRLMRNIDRAPLNPMGEPVLWDGQVSTDMMSHSHPPLVVYLMYPFYKLGGEDPEWSLHLGFILFSLLLVTAVWCLAEFFALPPFPAAFLAFFSPAVFTVSHTVMMDLPALALGVTGVAAAFRGLRDNRPAAVLAGGAWIGAACLVSYVAVMFLLPPGVALLLSRRRLRNTLLLGLPPAACLGGWLAFVWFQTGRFVLADAARVVAVIQDRSYGGVEYRLFYNLVAAGSMVLFPAALLVWQWRTIRGKLYLLAALAIGFRLALRFPGEGTLRHALVAFGAAAGIILLVEGTLAAARAARFDRERRPFHLALAAWLPLLFLLTVKTWPHGAVRYLLWIVPPAVLCFLLSESLSPGPAGERPGENPAPGRRRRPLWALLAGGQVALALLAAWADTDLAGRQRAAVDAIFARYAAPGRTLWYAGEWGLRHYVSARGGKCILRYDRRPRPGDILVRPALLSSTYASAYEEGHRAQRIARLAVRTPCPLRTLSPRARAGFWSDYWGLLPLAPATGDPPLEILDVYRILQTLPPDPGREKDNLGILPPARLTVIPDG